MSHAATSQTVSVGIGALTIDEVVAVARYGAKVEITSEALAEVEATRERVEELAQDPMPVYGISTGFGALARRHIPEEMRAQLQLSLVRSHAAGTGPEVEEEVIRALMLLRLSTLCTGRTGVRPVVAQTYADVLNAGIVPVVREYGSLGCSGDLAPLAHCALALLGEGEVRVNGELQDAGETLKAAGIEPLVLREKEGLALINGTDGMLGMLCLAITDLRQLAKTADIATAMTVEGLLGTLVVFAEDLQELRPHPGQAAAAANILRVAEGSEILAAALEEFKKNQVQDAYSVRCAPQVAGGFRDTIEHAATTWATVSTRRGARPRGHWCPARPRTSTCSRVPPPSTWRTAPACRRRTRPTSPESWSSVHNSYELPKIFRFSRNSYELPSFSWAQESEAEISHHVCPNGITGELRRGRRPSRAVRPAWDAWGMSLLPRQ